MLPSLDTCTWRIAGGVALVYAFMNAGGCAHQTRMKPALAPSTGVTGGVGYARGHVVRFELCHLTHKLCWCRCALVDLNTDARA